MKAVVDRDRLPGRRAFLTGSAKVLIPSSLSESPQVG